MLNLFKFKGGVKRPTNKTQSLGRPIAVAPLPSRLVVPLHQSIGGTPRPVVQAGDKVLKGQLIGEADGWISAAVHAPTSGTVVAVDMHVQPHPSGLDALCVVIEPDGRDEWTTRLPVDHRALAPEEVRERLQQAGVVGLGGAVFPTHGKLTPSKTVPMQELVINGAECEPFITCDDLLMRERADEVVRGIGIFRDLLQPEKVLIGIEDNKPEAIAAMRSAAEKIDLAIEIVAMPTLYPGGGGKHITTPLTGLDTPSGGRTTDVGVQVFNVGTSYALARALNHGEPLISRIVTVTGHVLRPQNYEVLLGTPMSELLLHAGERDGTTGIIMGGPMMGFDVPDMDVPVVKATNCVLAKSNELFPPKPPEMPCIRCTQCVPVCPAELQPQQLYWFARAKDLGRAQEYHLFDCIECGCCSYVCPSHIPLVDYYRYAKSEIWVREKEKRLADIARERHEFRLFRQEREKKEKAERLAAKAQTKKAEAPVLNTAEQDAKKKLIQEALARAQAKKAAVTPKNTDNLPPDKQAEIAEIEARRAKIVEIAKQPVEPEGH
jgi:electron transport complex protein RnfC